MWRSTLVIGRYQINGGALKEKTRMLYPITTEPLNFDYTHQEFIYRMKNSSSMENGSNMAVNQRDYIIGSEVWKLNNHLSKSETEQSIARIRPFDVEEGKTKTVYVFTSQVLDITVDELIPSSVFFYTSPRETGNKILDALLRLLEINGGILLWNPKEICKETGIITSKLNSARKSSWFIKNNDWKLLTIR
jgi:hypothetical protein